MTWSLEAAERARRAQLASSIIRSLVVVAALGMVAGLSDRANDTRVTLAFFAVAFASVGGLWWLLQRGFVLLTSVVLAAWFWCLICFVTLFFGGLKGGNAACFGVAAMVAGSLVSGRAAVVVACLSSAWCALVGWLEATGRLPPQLGPYSVVNAWSAFTVSLIIMAWLLRDTEASLRSMHRRAEAAAEERDEALRRSIQSQKMELVGTMASGIAHDFNNVLSVIVNVSDALKSSRPHPHDAELLKDLDDATSRATLLSRQLLSLGRGQTVELTPVDFSAQVHNFAPMASRIAGPAIALEVDVQPGATVRASRAGLEQVLLNLVTNARDAMPGGGRLSLRLTVASGWAVLEVRDTGLGMDEETKKRVFNPFFTTKPSGMGLGLPTVQSTVASFGGEVSCTSAIGLGTTFQVRLPLAEMESPASVPPLPVTKEGKARLLLVDDDALVRRATARILEGAGFEVVFASDGIEALEQLERGLEVACVVSDIAMPRLDGEALAQRLEGRAVPVVLISGNRKPALSLVGSRRRFVPKPVDAATLLQAVAEARAEG